MKFSLNYLPLRLTAAALSQNGRKTVVVPPKKWFVRNYLPWRGVEELLSG